MELKEDKRKRNQSFRIIVVGDSDFITNLNLNLSGNRDFILNIIAWLSGEKSLITLRPNVRKSTPLFLKASQQRFLFFVPVVFLPLVSLCLGVAVSLNRRRHS